MTTYINLTTQQLKTESEIRSENPDTSYPVPFPVPEGYAIVFDAPQPSYDPYSQIVQQVEPLLTDKGHYEQQWIVVDLTGEALASAQERKVQDEASREAQRIQSLWQAAHDYEMTAISGSAVGLLTVGVLQSKPKAIAVQQWISNLWTDYYNRKADSSNTNYDFSNNGTCPYSVPEIREELGL